MIIGEKIERAFNERKAPETVLYGYPEATCDRDDALWFLGRDRHDITWKDWEEHYNGIFHFTHDALAYYLPSVMILSSQTSEKWLIAADSIITILSGGSVRQSGMSPFLGLKEPEYEVLKDWLWFLSGTDAYGGETNSGEINRALETVELLKRRTEQFGGPLARFNDSEGST